MSAVVFLLMVVAISSIGSVVVYVRNRTPGSLESSIDDFRREMQAIAPRTDTDRRRRTPSNG